MGGHRGRPYNESMKTWSFPVIACSLLATLALACTPEGAARRDAAGPGASASIAAPGTNPAPAPDTARANPLQGASTAERGARLHGRVGAVGEDEGGGGDGAVRGAAGGGGENLPNETGQLPDLH